MTVGESRERGSVRRKERSARMKKQTRLANWITIGVLLALGAIAALIIISWVA